MSGTRHRYGIVVRINYEKRLFYIWDHQKEYLALYRDFEADQHGNKHLILKEIVQFTPDFTKTGRPKAINVVPQRPPIPYDPEYRDDAIITELARGKSPGWARRTDGSTVVVFNTDVITFGELRVGTWIRFQPESPQPPGRAFRAREIEIYREDPEPGPGDEA